LVNHSFGVLTLLSIFGATNQPFCDGLSRRSFLSAGSLAFGGLTLPDVLRAQAAGAGSRDHSVVMIYLPGGPTQHETFDPKPSAPKEIRGSFSPISTSLPGVQFCELLPNLARMADRFSVVRTLVGMKNRHESFQCYSGRAGGRSEDSEPSGGWPTFGSSVSHVLGPGSDGMIPYVDAAPKMAHAPYNNHGVHDPSGKESWPGFTGRSHTPFTLAGDVKSNLVLNGINLDRLGDRKSLLGSLGRVQARASDRELDGGLDSFQQQAFGLLTSSRLAEALDLDAEDPRTLRTDAKDGSEFRRRDAKSRASAARATSGRSRRSLRDGGLWSVGLARQPGRADRATLAEVPARVRPRNRDVSAGP
jgi:hypothetical protein